MVRRSYPGKAPSIRDAQGYSLPAPVLGWDAVSPLAAMDPKAAVALENWFPQPGYVELRNGFTNHSATGNTSPVETLMVYEGVSSGNLFAASNTVIYDVTSQGAALSSHTGVNSPRFQWVNFATTGGHYLWACNGADEPIYWNGTAWAVTAITNVAGSTIVGVNAHKNRLWLIPSASSKAWYLATGAITGAATGFELGGLFTRGGYLVAMGTWTLDAGAGPDDYAVFISSRGQLAVYQGTDPASPNTWALVGVYDCGPPIGRRCFQKRDGDLAIITTDGVVPMSKVMVYQRDTLIGAALTKNIQRAMSQAADQYRGNFGWELAIFSLGNKLILNVPLATGVKQQQFVMNTLHGAWCLFTGMNANCWGVYQDQLFFGGNDGVVYQADVSGADDGDLIFADMQTAFSYYGTPGLNKRWTMCQPLLFTDGDVNPALGININFSNEVEPDVIASTTTSQSLWDQALWDQSLWGPGPHVQADWTSVAGEGFCASIRMQVAAASSQQVQSLWDSSLWDVALWDQGVPGPIILQVNGFNMTFETGAFV